MTESEPTAEVISIVSVAHRAVLQNEKMDLEDEIKERQERLAKVIEKLGVIAVIGVRE